MNSVELTEHKMLTAMFVDSHRPERRYMSRQDFAEYFINVEPALFRAIVIDLKQQGIAKAVPNGATYSARLHSNAHKAALSRILKVLGADTFSVDWQTKRILHDAQKAGIDKTIPSAEGWLLLRMEAENGESLAPAVVTPRSSRKPLPDSVAVAQLAGGSMSWINKYVAVWQGRIALGLAFFGTLVVGLWPDHARSIDPTRLVACILTGCAWLVAELASAASKVSNHDIALFERINNVMNDNALTFLMEHDFGHDLHSSQTTPVNSIAEWHGPNSMFNDKVIQRRWQAVFTQIADLAHLYGKTLVGTDHEGILTAWLLGFSRHDQPQHAKDEIKALNDTALALYKDFGEFVLFVRKRLDL